jgi:hypothetical protein
MLCHESPPLGARDAPWLPRERSAPLPPEGQAQPVKTILSTGLPLMYGGDPEIESGAEYSGGRTHQRPRRLAFFLLGHEGAKGSSGNHLRWFASITRSGKLPYGRLQSE